MTYRIDAAEIESRLLTAYHTIGILANSHFSDATVEGYSQAHRQGVSLSQFLQTNPLAASEFVAGLKDPQVCEYLSGQESVDLYLQCLDLVISGQLVAILAGETAIIERHERLEWETQKLALQILQYRRQHPLVIAGSLPWLRRPLYERQDQLNTVLALHKDLRQALKGVLQAAVETNPRGRSKRIALAIREAFPSPDPRLPKDLNRAIALAHSSLVPDYFVGLAARELVKFLSQRFIAGSTAKQAVQKVIDHHQIGRGTILDVLGAEENNTPAQAEAYIMRYLDILDEAERRAPEIQATKKSYKRPQDPGVKRFAAEYDADLQLSVKFSQMSTVFDPARPQESATEIRAAMRRLLDKTADVRKRTQLNTCLMLDLEFFSQRELTYNIITQLLDEEYADREDIGFVVQANMRDSAALIDKLAAWSRARGGSVKIRLVKGAYHGPETELAARHGYASPVFSQKNMTDENFERCIRKLFENADCLRPSIAGHNPRSHARAIVLAREMGVPMDDEFLMGLEDLFKQAVSSLGMPTSVYTPIEMEPLSGSPYLLRRFDETTDENSIIVRMANTAIPDQDHIAPPLTDENRAAFVREFEPRAVRKTPIIYHGGAMAGLLLAAQVGASASFAFPETQPLNAGLSWYDADLATQDPASPTTPDPVETASYAMNPLLLNGSSGLWQSTALSSLIV